MDMKTVMARAKDSNSSFVIHCGDMCNHYTGSPELLKPYLESGIPVYGVYGNHELEGPNSMEMVTPLLTNDKEVVWGTEDGKIGDGTIAYYYKDLPDDYRIVATDTNYAFDPKTGDEILNTCSCSMCKRHIINSGIKTVYVRSEGGRYIAYDTSAWIENDDSLTGNTRYMETK